MGSTVTSLDMCLGDHSVDVRGEYNSHVKDTPEGHKSLFLFLFPHLCQAQASQVSPCHCPLSG